MGWYYAWATREYCMYHLTYAELLIYWREGKIQHKKEALRIGCSMWGVDIDAESKPVQPESQSHDPDRAWFRQEFGMEYEELMGGE